ncbi:MAG: tetratricopeptide repeat protein, partial [Bacteroidota bacterium]
MKEEFIVFCLYIFLILPLAISVLYRIMSLRILLFLLCIFFMSCVTQARFSDIFNDKDTRISLIKIEKKDTSEVNRLNELALSLKKKGEFKKGLSLALQANRIATKISYKKGQIDSYINQVGLYEALGDNLSAKESLNKGFALANKTMYKKGLVLLYRNSGVLNIVENNYPEALDDFYKSLKIAEEINYKQGISYAYNNMGNLNLEQGNYSDAKKNYLNTLKLSEELKDSFSLSYAYNNLGYLA